MRSDIVFDDASGRATVIDLPPTLAVVLPICRAIGLSETVETFCPMKPGKHLRNGPVTEFTVLSILQEPRRPPLYKMNQWAEQYGLELLYGHGPASFNDDRIGRTLDAIDAKRDEIEKAIVSTVMRVYDINPEAIHWDLMHLRFSDGKQETDLVCPGYGHGAIHERQVQFSAHMDSASGLPLHHELFPGRKHQAPLAKGLLDTLQGRLDGPLIVVADRASIGYDNIVNYQAKGTRFLSPLQVSDPQMREQLAATPAEKFEQLRYRSMHDKEPVNSCYATTVLLNPSKTALAKAAKEKTEKPPAIQVQALFVLNTDRQSDDCRKRNKLLRKRLERMAKIDHYITNESRSYRSYRDARKRIEAAIPKSLKGILCYELSEHQGKLSFRYWVDRKALRRARRADGRHILLHSLQDTHTPDQIFELYRNQAALESQFRSLNHELEINPCWLQKESRIRALTLLYFIALIVYSILGLLARKEKLATEHYYRMTPREMLQRCHALRLIRLKLPRQPAQYWLDMPPKQRDIRRALRLPPIMQWLQLPP